MEGFPQQTNFSAGEVSPLLLGRNDISKYANGLQVCENFIVKPQGAIRRRSGTRYVNGVKTNANFTRLKKFQFSTTVYYMLEFGNQYIRIYAVNLTTWTLVTVSSVPLELVTPYQTADLQFLKFSQSADEMFITHPNYPPAVVSFSGGTSWAYNAVDFDDGLEQLCQDGPYLDTDTRNYTMFLQGVGVAGLTSTANDFTTASVGKYVIISNNAYLITQFLTTNSVNVQLICQVDPVTYTNGGGVPAVNYTYTAGSILIRGVNYQGSIQTTLVSNGNPSTFQGNTKTQNGLILVNGTHYLSGYIGGNSNSQIGITAIVTIQSTIGTLTLGGANPGLINQITITSTNADFSSGNVGSYVEYNFRGNLVVGLIIQFIDSHTVLVQPFDNIVDSTALDPTCTFLSSSTNVTVRGVTFPLQLQASRAVWTNASQYSYIKVNGSWYLTGYHSDSQVTVGGVAQDVMGVQLALTVVTTSGRLAYSNHLITATLQCTQPVFNSSTDVGRCFRLNYDGLIVWGQIMFVTSTTVCGVQLGRMLPQDPQKPSQLIGNGQTSLWQLGAWYVGNYPSVTTFHEGRMCFGCTSLQPQTFWMSNSEDFFNFAPTLPDSTVTDACAITSTVDSGIVNNILWFKSTTGVLLMGTIGSEWEITSSSFGSPLSPLNIVVNEQTNHGSNPISDPQKVGSRILFIQKSGNKLKELSYFFQTNSYIANDMTILSEHILRSHGGASFTAWSQEPNNTMWILCNDGTIAGFTYDYEQQISAWHHHTISGGFVESIETVPSIDNTEDNLFMIVRRTINGSTVRYIEFMEQENWPTSPTDKNGMFFVDCGGTITNSNLTVLNGSGSYLVGQTVKVIADGTMRNDVVVPSNGNITISGLPASVVTWGLAYNSDMYSLPIDSGSVSGTSQGKLKRVHMLTFRFYNSIGIKYGSNLNSLTEIPFRKSTDNLGQSPNLFTGDKKIEVPSDFALQGTYAIRQDQPYPLTILTVMPQLQTFQ